MRRVRPYRAAGAAFSDFACFATWPIWPRRVGRRASRDEAAIKNEKEAGFGEVRGSECPVCVQLGSDQPDHGGRVQCHRRQVDVIESKAWRGGGLAQFVGMTLSQLDFVQWAVFLIAFTSPMLATR